MTDTCCGLSVPDIGLEAGDRIVGSGLWLEWRAGGGGVGVGWGETQVQLFLKAASSSRATRPQMELDLSLLLNSCEIIIAFDLIASTLLSLYAFLSLNKNTLAE